MRVPLRKLMGEVAAEDMYSPIDVPPFNRSAVDGYAVISDDISVADEENPVELKLLGSVKVGVENKFTLQEGSCVHVATGSMTPENSDSVVMKEYTEEKMGKVLVYKPTFHNENLILKGSDISKGELLVAKGTEIGLAEIGLLASAGIKEISVYGKPMVSIVVTGPEIALPGEKLGPGKIYDVNSYTLHSALKMLNCRPRVFRVPIDEPESLKRKIRKSSAISDFVFVIGGSSKGEYDFTLQAVREVLKPSLIIQGLSSKPGKPTIIAVKEGKIIMGLPGQPASCITVFNLIMREILEEVTGKKLRMPKIKASLSSKIYRRPEREEIIYVSLKKTKGKIYAYPIKGPSGHISIVSRANGYLKVDKHVQILEKNQEVEVTLLPWRVQDMDTFIEG